MKRIFSHQFRFLLAELCVVLLGGFIWGWIGIALYIETGFFAIMIGFLAGFVASLYFERENKWFYPTTATSFSLIGIFVGKYIIFAYYELDGLLIEQESSKMFLAYKAILGLTFTKLKAYSNYTAEQFDFFDFIWAVLALGFAQANAMRVSRYKRALYRFKQSLRRQILGKEV